MLEQLDVVVASVHSRMQMDEDEMTRRLVRCMSLPVFKIWGHALGRLLLEREPFACRVEEVLDALAASRGAVEVNGDPRRLELEPRWLRAATARADPGRALGGRPLRPRPRVPALGGRDRAPRLGPRAARC